MENKSSASAGQDERIWCMNCGKSVSTLVPKGTIVRAWVQCPECIQKNAALALRGTAEQASAAGEEQKAAKRERIQVLDDVIDRLQERMGHEEYGHAKAAVALDIEAVEEMKQEGELLQAVDETECPAKDDVYECTLDKNHEGPHKAHGFDRVLHQWEQKEVGGGLKKT